MTCLIAWPPTRGSGSRGLSSDAALANPLELAGTAGQQVATLTAQIEKIAASHPEAAGYHPGPVL